MKSAMSKKVKKWMIGEVEENAENYFAFPPSREISSTMLAENAAHHFGHDEWLDDPDNGVWFLAADVAIWWEEKE